MGTFRYTIGTDYNEDSSFQGYYEILDGDGQLFLSGPNITKYIDRFLVGPYLDEVLGEATSAGYNILTQSNGQFVPVEGTGFSFNYSDSSHNIIINSWMLGDHIYTGSGNDYLSAYGGDDYLYGNDGNDVLEGGDGADVLYGGTGINTASYGDARSGVTVDLNLQGVAQISDDEASGDILFNISNLIGNFGNDTFIGDAADNVLTSRSGSDTLRGDGGNDLLNGGEGADVLDGGDGLNTASYVDSRFNVTVNLSLGNAAQISDGDANGDTLFNIQNLSGSRYADILTGDANANVLEGGAGNDTLRGGGGADTLFGGDGDDRLVIYKAGASVDGGGDASHPGKDVLYLQGADNFAFTDATFTGIETVYVGKGSGLDLSTVAEGVSIISQSVAGGGTEIIGSHGNDTITTGKGYDFVYGNDGNDIIMSNSGNQEGVVLYGDAGNDVLKGGAGYDLLFGGEGNDAITGSSDYAEMHGGAGDDVIKGGSGSSLLDGGTGADKLVGGGYEDVFVFYKGHGRENVYNFTRGEDIFDIGDLANTFEEINISSLNGGKNTLITFDKADIGDKIILHDYNYLSLRDEDFGFIA